MGFSRGTKAKVSTELLRKLTTDVEKNNRQFTQMVKAEYTAFGRPPVDTGLSRSETSTKIRKQKKSVKIILFTTDKVVNEQGQPYAIYWYLGLGTNRKYGPRPVHEQAAKRIINNLGDIV